MTEVALLCGGPSRERGISLNSARSVMDHLGNENIRFHPIYVNQNLEFFAISCHQLYSNTPDDFDFKLGQTAEKLSHKDLQARLKSMDMVFPAIHGAFGEDGALQKILEDIGVPFIGPSSAACEKMFHKHNAAQILAENGFNTIPSALLKADSGDNETIIRAFFQNHKLQRAVIKPVAGGSSIGVFSVTDSEAAIEKCHYLFEEKIDTEAIIEPFCEGKEFTVVVLQNLDGRPVAMIPTEIEISYENNQILDYRRKYLPTANTLYHTPPRFSHEIINLIQEDAEAIFDLFEMRDFGRLDGWLMNDGKVYFTDLNPISGMEQNSFLFRQSSLLGISHSELFWSIFKRACHRERIEISKPQIMPSDKKKVHVLFGGPTAERQVSLMSGTNVWLKLRHSAIYEPEPFLLDPNGSVWHLPYSYALNHTVEEIYDNCLHAEEIIDLVDKLTKEAYLKMDHELPSFSAKNNLPQKLSLEEFMTLSQQSDAFVFLGLHGGDGENGTLQQKLNSHNIIHNGSGPVASQLCMDKYLTGMKMQELDHPYIRTASKKVVSHSDLKAIQNFEEYWEKLCQELGCAKFVIKPRCDGCSAGVVKITRVSDLETYIQYLKDNSVYIPSGVFTDQLDIIEMSLDIQSEYLIEECIDTDIIEIKKNSLVHKKRDGWIELTAGVLEQENQYHAFNPSIAVSAGMVLSLEEKFQGGTGINITPPPQSIVAETQLYKLKAHIAAIAAALGIENYARIDLFYNIESERIILIEANSLPALTPSTVIYHQALAEKTPLTPIQFLEKVIQMRMAQSITAVNKGATV